MVSSSSLESWWQRLEPSHWNWWQGGHGRWNQLNLVYSLTSFILHTTWNHTEAMITQLHWTGLRAASCPAKWACLPSLDCSNSRKVQITKGVLKVCPFLLVLPGTVAPAIWMAKASRPEVAVLIRMAASELKGIASAFLKQHQSAPVAAMWSQP